MVSVCQTQRWSERCDSKYETIAPRISEFSAHHPGNLFGLHGLEGIFVVEQLHRRRRYRSIDAAGQDHRTAAGQLAGHREPVKQS